MNKHTVSSVAIIGAGASALTAAHTLLDAGYTVTLYEKSRGVGGRAATRKREGFIYDHGAQYIKDGNSISNALITQRFRTPDLIDITKPVWIVHTPSTAAAPKAMRFSQMWRSALVANSPR